MLKTGQSLADIAQEIIESRRINSEQVKSLRRQIFSEARILERMLDDGIVDREEAETLFAINDAVSFEAEDSSWRELFVEAITSHVLKDEVSPSALDEEEAQFIISRIERNGKIGETELDLLVNITASVTNVPASFQRYVLDALKEAVLKDGSVNEHNAERMTRVIEGVGSSSGQHVDEIEKAWLKEIDGATHKSRNHSSWEILKLKLNIA